ncbi:MAG: hypothetical protein AAGC74_07740, partial [Verrucomicrobiota bacterium]
MKPLYCTKAVFISLPLLLSKTLPAVDLQDLLPLQEGYSVVTCSSGLNFDGTGYDLSNPVVAIFKTDAAELALVPTGDDSAAYDWPCFHNEEIFQDIPSASEVWTGENLGEVFGVTLDDQTPPNIYVSASSAYVSPSQPEPVWPAGESAGSIYRLDGTTGEITSCIQLPSISSAALGNLAFYRDGNGDPWLYASNLEDGLIYRVSTTTCTVASTFAHPSAPADDGLAGPAPFGRRIWGVAVHQDRLFYHLWNDYTTTPQQIWSVNLNTDGSFDLTDVDLELNVPVYDVGPSGPPISDIDFDDDGNMYLAERSFAELYVPHNARVLKAIGSPGSYTACPENTYLVGSIDPADNSAGGVAADCNGRLWVTSNYINASFPTAYGLQSFEEGGNIADVPIWANSYIVDLDGLEGQSQKDDFGEVDRYRTTCDCLEVETIDVDCPEQPGSYYSVTLDLTNLSSQQAFSWSIDPCPQAELPEGTITVGSTQTGTFSPLLDPDTSQIITPSFPVTFADQTVCFNLTIYADHNDEICTIKYCVDLPNCDCFEVVSKKVICQHIQGEFKWTFDVTLTNNSSFTANAISIEPLPGSTLVADTAVITGGPIAPGETGSATLCIESSGDPALEPGDILCFDLVLEVPGTPDNCSEECCLFLPPCATVVKPDTCLLTKRAPCCPTTGTATVSYTICNNSTETRTYDWSVDAAPGCDISLAPFAFSPSSGTLTIPAETCVVTLVTVDCSSLSAGECAAFEFCFQQTSPAAGPEICCKGSVYSSPFGEIIAKIAKPHKPIGVQWGEINKFKLQLTNPTQQNLNTTLHLTSDLGALDFGQGLNQS